MATVNNLPAELDWAFIADNDISLVVTIKDSAGSVIDVTGNTYTALITFNDGTTQAVAAAITNAAGGEVTLTLAQASNTKTGGGTWYLDEDDGSAEITLLSGSVKVSPKGSGA